VTKATSAVPSIEKTASDVAVVEISHFNGTMSELQRRTHEWSSAFNEMMTDLGNARQVTISTVAPKYHVGSSDMRLEPSIVDLFPLL
jgi:hypothetical protein